MSKVFCSKCNFFIPGIAYIMGIKPPDSECCSPDNLKDSFIIEKRQIIDRPQELNKNNDCKLYKKRNQDKESRRYRNRQYLIIDR